MVLFEVLIVFLLLRELTGLTFACAVMPCVGVRGGGEAEANVRASRVTMM